MRTMGQQQPGNPEGNQVTWVVWEAREHLGRAVGVLLLILLVSAGVRFSLGDPYLGGLALVVLLIAVLPYYLPSRYTVDDEGVGVESLIGNRRKPWANLKVYFPDGDRGVLLSPVAKFGLLARSRGLYLPFRGNSDTARAIVARHLPAGKVEPR